MEAVLAPALPVAQPAAPATLAPWHRLQRLLLEAISSSPELATAFGHLARITAQATEAHGVFLFGRDPAGQLACTGRYLPQGPLDMLDQDLKEGLDAACQAACQAGELTVGRFVTTTDWVAVTAPVFHRGRLPDALAAVVPDAKREPAQPVLQLAAAHVTLWHNLQAAAHMDAQVQTATALLELLEKLAACDDLAQAGSTLANELQRYLACQQVVLGLCRRHQRDCRLTAVSGLAQFDRRSDFTRDAEAMFAEALLRNAATVWPPQAEADRHATRAHQKLCMTAEAEGIFSAPLRNQQGEMIGVWAFLGTQALLERPQVAQFAELCAKQVGTWLQLQRRLEANVITGPWRKLTRRIRRWPLLAGVTGAALLAGVLAIPLPYKMRCDAQIQPVLRRYVAAPFQGTLEKALVAPGDLVSEGDILARLDGREIRWELDGLSAEHSREAKKRDSAMAGHKVADAQLAKLEMERLESKRQLLEDRIQHLEIKSPIQGIVVSGDLEKAEGAPLTIGQSLFEIAPLDRMVVEVAIPQEEIQYAAAGQQVELRLDAYPRRSWQATIEKIHPRTEMRDDQSVFIAELELDNPDGLLRPGMKGRSKISCARHPLVWNWFHRPWEKLLQVWGW
jgi:RND family efflux transporter MFP subunit